MSERDNKISLGSGWCRKEHKVSTTKSLKTINTIMYSKKISLIIPVGKFSFFIHACLKNVFETCGISESLDFVFLTSKNVSPEIHNAFKEEKKNFPFRVVSAPFDSGSNHLALLDWAVSEADISEWIIIQHCDTFWKEKNWIDKIRQEIKPTIIAICTPQNSRYNYQSHNIPIVGDFFGAYNRKLIIKHNLFFKWGLLGNEVHVSNNVAQAINCRTIIREDNEPIIFGKEFMDGSQAMGWELVLLDWKNFKDFGYSNYIKVIPLKFFHICAFFRIAENIQRHYKEIKCNFDMPMTNYIRYSYITSFCIERSEVERIALPWRLMFDLEKLHKLNINFEEISWIQSYSKAKDVIGWDRMGLKTFDANGTKYENTIILKLM